MKEVWERARPYLGRVEFLAGRVVGGEQALEDAVDAVVALHVRAFVESKSASVVVQNETGGLRVSA